MRQLKRELRWAGATGSELSELASIAARLQLLQNPVSDAGHAHGRSRFGKAFWPALAVVCTGLCASIVLVVVSQSALPTSRLYAIQRLSDSIAVAVHPAYRATVMMRRAQQVRQLVAARAQPEIVLATLADYDSQASLYRSAAHTNYVTLEHCKTDLRRAATIAPPAIRRAIQGSLKTLDSA